MTATIFLVEDDPLIISALTELLMAEGYDVVSRSSEQEALELFETSARASIDLALVDVTLREGNGFSVCTRLKEVAPTVPVIFLTASGDETSTVAGLRLGADDYIAKPFRPQELLARIAVAIRRHQTTVPLLKLGDITINTDRAKASKNGRELMLSAVEYRLLLHFATHKHTVVTRESIRQALWDDAGTYIETNTLSVYVKRLREKIENDPAHPRLITTVRGIGYRVSES